MSDEQDAEGVTGEDTTTAPEAVVSSQEQENIAPERDYEAEAKEQGWRPEEEWKGEPKNWKDAKTYVEHGEHITRVADARVAKVEKAMQERFEKLERVSNKAIENLRAQHAKELDALKAQRREAVKAGDVETVDQLDEQIEKHREAGPETEKPEDARAVQEAWIKQHDWWEVDEDMTAYAIGISQGIAVKNPKITMAENLAKTTEALQKKYPEKFGLTTPKKPSANGHALVDGGGALNGGGPKSPLTGIPASDLAVGRRHVKEGLFPTIEAWAKEYQNA